jgi:hypothetical protein
MKTNCKHTSTVLWSKEAGILKKHVTRNIGHGIEKKQEK